MNPTLIQKALRVNIIELLGLQSLPEEEKLRLVDSLTQLISTKIMMRIGEKLSPEDQAVFDTALDTGTEEQTRVWLKVKGIDLDEITVEEVAKVKDDLLARTDALP